jgi:hypothetical protein
MGHDRHRGRRTDPVVDRQETLALGLAFRVTTSRVLPGKKPSAATL